MLQEMELYFSFPAMRFRGGKLRLEYLLLEAQSQLAMFPCMPDRFGKITMPFALLRSPVLFSNCLVEGRGLKLLLLSSKRRSPVRQDVVLAVALFS
jgi:hypothetical protein